MVLNKLFGNKNTQNIVLGETQVKKTIGYYARKVAMVLGLGAAVSGPAPMLAQEQVTFPLQNQEVPELPSIKETPSLSAPPLLEPAPIKAPSLKFAKALPGDSVVGFLTRNFGVQTGWELLVEKDSGKRVLNPQRDLIAGKEYMLARNEKEASTLSAIYKKREGKIGATSSAKQKPETSKKTNITYHIPTGAFDFTSFLQAISGVESGGKYTADNTKKGVEYGVKSEKHAKGKYQFTNETLAGFGYDTEEKRKKFLQSSELQEKLMYKFTKLNYDFALQSPALSKLLQMGVHPTQILATMHHRGMAGAEWVAKYAIKQENPVQAFFHRLETVKGDWLGTKTSKYVQAVSLSYSQIAQVDLIELKSNPTQPNTQLASQEAIHQSPKTSDKKEVPTVASNDEVFDTPVLITASFEPTEQKQTSPDAPMIELIDVTPTTTVVEVVQEKYKKQLLSKIAQDASISLDVRKSLAKKLSEVDDLEVYYQEQIDYYTSVIRTSRNDIEKQKAKRILPGLYKLLQNTKIIMASSNDETLYRKKAA